MQRTKLHRFMDREGLTDTQLAKASGISIRQVNYLKLGEKEPRRTTMIALLNACSTLLGRDVAVTDIFDFSLPKRKAA